MFRQIPYRLILALATLCHLFQVSSAQTCNPQLVLQNIINDGMEVGELLWETTFTGTGVTDLAFSDENYNRFFTLTTTEPSAGNYKVEVTAGPEFRDYLDIDPRNGLPSFGNVFFNCDGQVNKTVTFNAVWEDENTRPPEFKDTTPLTLPITTTWDRRVPLNWEHPILTTDKDYSFVHSQPLDFTTSVDGIFRFEQISLNNETTDPRPMEFEYEIKIFLDEGYVPSPGRLEVEVTATDGKNGDSPPLLITLDVTENLLRFEEVHYFQILENWPAGDSFLQLDKEIEIVGGNDGIIFEVDEDSGLQGVLEFSVPSDPGSLKFLRSLTPSDKPVLTGLIKASKGDLFAEARLTLQLPARPVYKFQETFHHFAVPEDDALTFPIENALVPYLPSVEAVTFTRGKVVPAEFEGIVEVTHNGNDVQVRLTARPDMDDTSDRVILVEVLAVFGAGADSKEGAWTTVALTVPPEPATACPTNPPTTVPPTCPPCETATTPEIITCPTDASTTPFLPSSPSSCEPCDCEGSTVTTTIATTSCPEFTTPEPCEPCSSTGTDSSTTITTSFPPTCPPPVTCEPCSSSDPTTVSTCLPCDCNATTGTPEVCTTPVPEPCPDTPCPFTTDPTTQPTGCPEPEPCTTPPVPEPCPSTTEPETCTPCPSTTDPTTGSSPPTSCPEPEPCTCTTPAPECPETPEPEPCTTPPPEPCPTTSEPENCTPCPFTPDPSYGTCAPCTTPVPEPCPTTLEPVCPTCNPCPSTCPPCTTSAPEPCPTSCPPPGPCDPDAEAECDCSNTGLIAGIAVVSVLFAGSLGAAAFLYFKLRSAGSLLSSSTPSYPKFNDDFSSPKKSFDKPRSVRPSVNNGWTNSAFSPDPVASTSGAGLQEVLTHPGPEPMPSAINTASPYMTAPLYEDSQPKTKSALAKPKEIAPDYEEGLNLQKHADAKPKSGGVKIADEVEIIDNDEENERL